MRRYGGMRGKLILFPVPIGAEEVGMSLPAANVELLNSCRIFIVEELRSARRFLKRVGYIHAIEDVEFFVLNEHTAPEAVEQYLDGIETGDNVGLFSEAGLPCVADPGAMAVRVAQQRGVEVVPLVGPSSLMLALMASGLGGQSFAFVGYLPVERVLRVQALHRLENRVLHEHQTQLFIEAPYRNDQLLDAIIATLRPTTRLCVACDITLPTQQIRMETIAWWKTERQQWHLHKRNTVFLIGE